MLGECLFWGALMALGAHIFFGEFLTAVHERRTTESLMRDLLREERELEARRERLSLRRQALESGDRTVLEQSLRDLGYIPADRIRVIDPPASDVPPGDEAARPPR